MTDAVKMVTGVTRDDAVKFLEQACRNWRHVPHLSNEDIADVMVALAVFARKANPANPTCNDSLQVAAPVKQSLTTDQAGALVAAPVVDHGITTSTVVDRAKGFYDTQAPLPTLQRLDPSSRGQAFDGEGKGLHADEQGLLTLGFDSHTRGFSTLIVRPRQAKDDRQDIIFTKAEVLAALSSAKRGEGK